MKVIHNSQTASMKFGIITYNIHVNNIHKIQKQKTSNYQEKNHKNNTGKVTPNILNTKLTSLSTVTDITG
jgi:hypothetical protein